MEEKWQRTGVRSWRTDVGSLVMMENAQELRLRTKKKKKSDKSKEVEVEIYDSIPFAPGKSNAWPCYLRAFTFLLSRLCSSLSFENCTTSM